MPVGEKLILALDVAEHNIAIELVERFKDYIGIFKVVEPSYPQERRSLRI